MAIGLNIGIDDVSRKGKKIYLGMIPEGDSLIVNGNFSNGLEHWDTGAMDSWVNISVINDEEVGSCVKMEVHNPSTSSGSIATLSYVDELPLSVYGHYYYFSVKAKQYSATSSLRPRMRVLSVYTDVTDTQNVWEKHSKIYKSNVTGTAPAPRLSHFIGIVSENQISAGDYALFTDARLYDLTEMFGAGNEPTVEWCDANGEELKNIYKYGVARKGKKGYIGVNGIARQFYPRLVPTTTAQLFFKLNDFVNYDKTIYGEATATLQDGTLPTLEFSTTSNGFYKSLEITGARDNIKAIINSVDNITVAKMNTVLLQTSYKSNTRLFTGVNSGTALRTLTFDFKTPRTLTLNTRIGSSDIIVYGSNDASSWALLGTADAAKACTVVSDTAYRYYKIETYEERNISIYYLYFENIQDWAEG